MRHREKETGNGAVLVGLMSGEEIRLGRNSGTQGATEQASSAKCSYISQRTYTWRSSCYPSMGKKEYGGIISSMSIPAVKR